MLTLVGRSKGAKVSTRSWPWWRYANVMHNHSAPCFLVVAAFSFVALLVYLKATLSALLITGSYIFSLSSKSPWTCAASHPKTGYECAHGLSLQKSNPYECVNGSSSGSVRTKTYLSIHLKFCFHSEQHVFIGIIFIITE